ncbi:MAG: ABC transporter permease [Trueperaceae bacterium]|nr:ABC transporter permease [Trueperaceae bacterium]
MSILWRLALKNLLRHRWRSLATVLGISLGIAAVLATLSVGENVRGNMAETLEAAAGQADLLVTPGAQGRAVFTIDDVLPLVEAEPGVAKVYPVLNFRAEPLRDMQGVKDSVVPGVDTGFQLSGRMTEDPTDLPVELISGSLPVAGSNTIAIASAFAELRDYKLGNFIEFASRFGTLRFEIVGLMDDSIGYASTNGGRVALLHLQDLQAAIRLEGRASLLEVMLTENADLDTVQAKLAEKVGEGFAVTYPAGSGNLVYGVIDTLEAGLRFLAATLLALGGFMAYNTFAAAIVERTREYALLRTICLTKAQVKQLALSEALLLSFAGVILGIALGIGLAYGIVRFNAVVIGFEFRRLILPGYAIVLASLIGVVVALIAGYLPATHASHTPPIVASRQAIEAGQIRKPLWGILAAIFGAAAALIPWPGLWSLLGAFFSIAGLFLGVLLLSPLILKPVSRWFSPLLQSVFGISGRLGADFALRNSIRNGVAIGTVVIGVALTLGVGSMVAGINKSVADWVDTTIIGDMFITSPVSFPQDFEATAKEAIPELDQVSGVGLRIVRFQPDGQSQGRSVVIILVDPERFNPVDGFGRFQYIDGQGSNELGYEALVAGGKVLAANTIHDRFGVNTGDTVSLRTNDGFRDFQVSGIVVDFTGGGETFVASLKDAELFGGGTPDLFVAMAKEGSSPQAVKDKLLATFPDLYMDITLNQNYRQRILDLTQRSFASTNALLALAIFIAALGVANTLGMNLTNRQHDIAVLRTLGLTRGEIRKVIFSEGIIVTTLGTLLGLAFGLLLSNIIIAGATALTGFIIETFIPLRLILIAIVASPILGLFASLFPANRAAKLSPVIALGSAR